MKKVNKQLNFDTIYKNRPDIRNLGSSGYSNLKHLYDLCMTIKPENLIESGTWKGNGSYILHYFGKLICHDKDFKNLMWKSDDIIYREYDIEKEDYTSMKNLLIFYDDHINQKKRLYHAKEQGFEHLVFDDNVSGEEAKKLRLPPVPTLKMIKAYDLPFVEEYKVLPYLGGQIRDTYLTYIKLKK